MKDERIKFTTTLIPLNVLNLNNRVYLDNENLRENIENFNERVKKLGVVYGEYGYPENGVLDTTLSKVSHTISNVRIEDNKVIGDITIVGTRLGNLLKDNYENMVFRPRSMGVVGEDRNVILKKLFTFDAVPNTDDAFNMENIEIVKKRKDEENNVLYERVYSDIDPYGEEKWEKE